MGTHLFICVVLSNQLQNAGWDPSLFFSHTKTTAAKQGLQIFFRTIFLEMSSAFVETMCSQLTNCKYEQEEGGAGGSLCEEVVGGKTAAAQAAQT